VATSRGRGNDGLWKAWENDKTVFPTLPPALGNRCGDSHITTATTTTGMNISQNPSKPKPGEMMHNITTQVGQIKWSKWATPE
jgi:hypothetical protein